MKINYVPGLALRFYPGLTRELYDGVSNYTANNCKIVIMSGDAPTETELWNLTNLETFITENADKIVHQESTTFEFKYDGFKHQRIIQRTPIDSTEFTVLNNPIAQTAYTQEQLDAGAIKTDNSLYALIYFPDKDTTLNVVDNDLIVLVPNVGTKIDDFVSLTSINFSKDDVVNIRNITISLFQGYQITDEVIMGDIEDPENPGEIIQGPVGTKKSIYYNKIWGNKISEAYRDCFIPRTTFVYKNATYSTASIPVSWWDLLNEGYTFNSTYFGLRKYDKLNATWSSSLVTSLESTIYGGFLVNESMVNLLDEINNRSMLSQLNNFNDLVETTTGSTLGDAYRLRYVTVGNTPAALPAISNNIKQNLLPGLYAKYALMFSTSTQEVKDSIEQLLIEQGFDEGMVVSALRSVVPINFDMSKYTTLFDKDEGILTIQNATPAKLKTRYRKSIHNPTNEALYIILPRYLLRAPIEFGILPAGKVDDNFTMANDTSIGLASSISSVTFPATSMVVNGEVVDETTQKIRLQDFTAISIGKTGNGQTDLEYDLVDLIDYIDSLTLMVKIPNKY